MPAKLILTPEQKRYIFANYIDHWVADIALHLSISESKLRQFMRIHGLKTYSVKRLKSIHEIKRARKRIVFELWVENVKLYDTLNTQLASELKTITRIREKHKEIIEEKPFIIYKRIPSIFPPENPEPSTTTEYSNKTPFNIAKTSL